MSVIHILKRENPYVQIDKRVLEDPRLTWRSKGILAYLLSKPSGWKVNVKDIWQNGAEGRNAVQDCLSELREFGYATLIQTHGDAGKLTGSQWQITEEPKGGFPVGAEKPKIGTPRNRKSGFRAHSNNEDSLIENQNNNEGGSENENSPARAENQTPIKEKTEQVREVPPGRAAAEKSITLHDPALPGVTIVAPMPGKQTTLDAEKAIIDWCLGDGFETVKYRHETAGRNFEQKQVAQLAAHYVSIYASTNESSRARLMSDPVRHFQDGLYKYLMNETAFTRNAPGHGGAVRGNGKANINRLGSDPSVYSQPQKF